jgi:DNA-binding NarL/FixJ family response regulator
VTINDVQRQAGLAAGLSPREIEVIRLLSLGCTVKEIASVLGISTSTVENHKARTMRKLGVFKSVLLTRIAIKLGISDIDDRLTDSEQLFLKDPPFRNPIMTSSDCD